MASKLPKRWTCVRVRRIAFAACNGKGIQQKILLLFSLISATLIQNATPNTAPHPHSRPNPIPHSRAHRLSPELHRARDVARAPGPVMVHLPWARAWVWCICPGRAHGCGAFALGAGMGVAMRSRMYACTRMCVNVDVCACVCVDVHLCACASCRCLDVHVYLDAVAMHVSLSCLYTCIPVRADRH